MFQNLGLFLGSQDDQIDLSVNQIAQVKLKNSR